MKTSNNSGNECGHACGGACSESVVLDVEAALKRMDGDQELYREIVGCFLEDTPVQVKRLGEALESGLQDVAYRQAHSIKSAAANIGAEGLRDAALQMEMAAKDHGVGAAIPLFDLLVSELESVKSHIQQLGVIKP